MSRVEHVLTATWSYSNSSPKYEISVINSLIYLQAYLAWNIKGKCFEKIISNNKKKINTFLRHTALK